MNVTWMNVSLGDLFDFKNGLNAEKAAYGDGIPFVNVMDVFGNDVLTTDIIRGRMQATKKQESDYSVKRGDVLFNRTSETFEEVAMSAVYLDDQPAIFGGFVIRARPLNTHLDPHFCAYFFQSNTFRKELIRRGQGAVRANIGQKDLATVPALVPPLPEQKRIAEILSTWDQAIEATENLIANSDAQKKALMQQLLTGKKRLPGFAKEWKSARLDDLFSFKKGQGISKQMVCEEGAHPCVLYGELYTRYEEIIDNVARRTNSDEGVPSIAGDLLVPASTTTSGIDLANVTAIGQAGIKLGGDINILRMKNANVSAPFFAYYLTHIKKHNIASRAQGITIIHLYAGHLKDIEVHLPPLEEQKRISDVILNASHEIKSQKEKLLKLKAEKSALMQQLLTGKRRVKLKEEKAA